MISIRLRFKSLYPPFTKLSGKGVKDLIFVYDRRYKYKRIYSKQYLIYVTLFMYLAKTANREASSLLIDHRVIDLSRIEFKPGGHHKKVTKKQTYLRSTYRNKSAQASICKIHYVYDLVIYVNKVDNKKQSISYDLLPNLEEVIQLFRFFESNKLSQHSRNISYRTYLRL